LGKRAQCQENSIPQVPCAERHKQPEKSRNASKALDMSRLYLSLMSVNYFKDKAWFSESEFHRQRQISRHRKNCLGNPCFRKNRRIARDGGNVWEIQAKRENFGCVQIFRTSSRKSMEYSGIIVVSAFI